MDHTCCGNYKPNIMTRTGIRNYGSMNKKDIFPANKKNKKDLVVLFNPADATSKIKAGEIENSYRLMGKPDVMRW